MDANSESCFDIMQKVNKLHIIYYNMSMQNKFNDNRQASVFCNDH